MASVYRKKGFPQTVRAIQHLGIRSLQAGAGALYREAERIIGDSQEHYVPVDLAVLKNSGHVQLPEVRGRRITVQAGFGGPAAPYALAVHENPRAGKTGGVSPQGRRYKHWAKVGGWKYLEKPFKAATPSMDARIAKDIKSEVRL